MSKIQSLKGVPGKETIYVDVDDEITGIIDKIQAAKSKVVALVLPKRAPVLQSVVNMKLLKRAAESAEKNLVLVTSETGLMPLAGAVGLHVASTPTSKPSVPAAPAGPDDEPEDADAPLDIVDGNDDDAANADADAISDKGAGEPGASSVGKKAVASDVDESIDMSGDEADEPAEAAAPVPKPKKNGRLRVPNFDSFRKKLALGVLTVALLVTGWVYAFMILPKVTVTIKSDTSTVTTNLNLVLDTSAKDLDAANNIVPAISQSQQKTATEQVPATGSQNNGEKASGKVTFKLKNCNTDTVTIPTGSGISSGGQTYITQSAASISSIKVGGNCNPSLYSNVYTATVNVVAYKGGASYNVPNNTSFTLPSSIDGANDVSATANGAITGGTDDIIKVVTQSDIDGATGKISEANSATLKDQLAANLKAKGMYPIPTTFLAGSPQVTTSAKAGDAADTVVVTAVTTYTMLGVQKADLVKLVSANVSEQIDKNRQTITDDGVNNAKFDQSQPATTTGAAVAMQTKSVAGPSLNETKLKKQIAGQKGGGIKTSIKQTPGVTDVDVHFSPFWVNVAPKNIDRITVNIVKADG